MFDKLWNYIITKSSHYCQTIFDALQFTDSFDTDRMQEELPYKQYMLDQNSSSL